MFSFILAALLFTVRSSSTSKVKYSNETAEAGLCVVILCNFTSDHGSMENAAWYKCEQSCTNSEVLLSLNNTNPNAQSGFRQRVSLLETGLNGNNCSIIINDITKSDSGSYEFRLKNTHQRAAITVKDLSQKPTLIIPPLTEGQQVTLTCIAPGLCSGSVPDITWVWRERGENDSHITGNITAFTTENVTAVTKRHSSTLTFYATAEHKGTEVTCKVSFANNITTEETATLNVTYVWKLEISGNTPVKRGDTLNLTCSTDGNHSYVITWANLNVNKGLKDKSGSDLQRATLVILNATEKHSEQYICEAKHQNNTLREEVHLPAKLLPKILNSSGCINKSGILTCMCISQGFPIPTIKWPLLRNLFEYSVVSTLSNHTVNSTVTLAARHQNDTTVKCVSNNANGDVKKNLDIQKVEEKKEEEEEEGQYMKWLRKATQLEVVIAFAIGVLLCAIICCFARKCPRKKPRTHGGVAESLEMVTTHSDPLVTNHEEPLIDAGQAQECDHAINQEVAEAGGAMAAENSDVNYSNLDFSLMKSPAGVTQSTAEADYAEIRKEKAEERQEEEEEDEDTALYSTVKDVMDGN